jgi:hypothetical protein
MLFKLPVRRTLSFAALAAAALVAACAEKAPPPPPPAPPAPPPVSLSSKLIDQASAYRFYVSHTTAISPAFTSGADVAAGLRTGAAYEPDQLLSGAIAYGAVAALQDPAFVAAVRVYATDPTQRRTIAYEIMKDPAYVVGINGSASAAGLVIAALGDDATKLLVQGRLVKWAAYDIQHSTWSKAEVAGRDARLAMAKQLASTPVSGDVAETGRLQQASVGATPLGLTGQAASPPYTPLVIRSMAVAALAALGYADDANLAQVMPLMAEPSTANCLNMAKLNLYQCLAVAKPHYEDVFCLGQHIMMDTASCLMKGVGLSEPEDPHMKELVALAAERQAAKAVKASAKPVHKRRKR